MEAKTTVTVPEAYRVIIEDLRLLQRDGQNPNKMTEKQKASTWKSLCDFGWTAPSAIVVNAFDPDGRAYAVDEFYKRETTDEELAKAAKELQETWGEGTFWCDARFPQSILKLCRAGLDAKPYTFKREDGLRELGSRLTPASDGKPRQFISKRCVNLISELLEYREDVKENDHTTDALRIVCRLQLKRSRFSTWLGDKNKKLCLTSTYHYCLVGFNYFLSRNDESRHSKAKIVTPNAVTAVE